MRFIIMCTKLNTFLEIVNMKNIRREKLDLKKNPVMQNINLFGKTYDAYLSWNNFCCAALVEGETYVILALKVKHTVR